MTFAPQVVQTSCCVIGACIGGEFPVDAWAVWASSFALAATLILFVREGLALRRFRRLHHHATWVPAEPPANIAEVDDPILALGGRMHILRPHLRSRGGFEVPDDDAIEPARTDRALRRMCSRSRAERPGDVLETLPMYLDDANHDRGVYYNYVQICISLALAALTGLMHATPWGWTTPGGFTMLALVICALHALALLTPCAHALKPASP